MLVFVHANQAWGLYLLLFFAGKISKVLPPFEVPFNTPQVWIVHPFFGYSFQRSSDTRSEQLMDSGTNCLGSRVGDTAYACGDQGKLNRHMGRVARCLAGCLPWLDVLMAQEP